MPKKQNRAKFEQEEKTTGEKTMTSSKKNLGKKVDQQTASTVEKAEKVTKKSAQAVPPVKCGGPETESPKQSATSRTFALLSSLSENEQKKALVIELFNGMQTHSYDPRFEDAFEYGVPTVVPEKPLSLATWIEYISVCPSVKLLLDGTDTLEEISFLFQELVGTLVARTTSGCDTLFIRFLSDGNEENERFFFVVTHIV